MISVVIETRNDEVALAHCLASLVSAATEGVVREVIVLDHGSRDGTAIVADAAGCVLVEVSNGGPSARVAAIDRARGDWLLFLPPMAMLQPGWQSDVLTFLDRAMVSGRGMKAVGRISGGRLVLGWRAVLAALSATLVRRDEGLLVAKAAWLAANASLPTSSVSSVSGARRGAA